MNEYPLTEILIVALLVCISLGYLAQQIRSAVRTLSKPHTGGSNCDTCGGCSAGKPSQGTST